MHRVGLSNRSGFRKRRGSINEHSFAFAVLAIVRQEGAGREHHTFVFKFNLIAKMGLKILHDRAESIDWSGKYSEKAPRQEPLLLEFLHHVVSLDAVAGGTA
jgi:hypothetical protein